MFTNNPDGFGTGRQPLLGNFTQTRGRPISVDAATHKLSSFRIVSSKFRNNLGGSPAYSYVPYVSRDQRKMFEERSMRLWEGRGVLQQGQTKGRMACG